MFPVHQDYWFDPDQTRMICISLKDWIEDEMVKKQRWCGVDVAPPIVKASDSWNRLMQSCFSKYFVDLQDYHCFWQSRDIIQYY